MGMYRKEKYNVLVVGVGGQGILTLSRLLAEAALNNGYNVVVSEIHGLAQRGGSVAVHVRIALNNAPLAPLIPRGGANIMVALEGHEALRYLEYLSPQGVIILNKRIIPPSVPNVRIYSIDDVIGIINKLGIKHYDISAEEVALKLGKPYVTNVVILGFLAKIGILPIAKENFIKAIRKVFSERVATDNITAFEEGYKYSMGAHKASLTVMKAQ